ncbi:MAG: 23S rRNA (guanine(2445)-N(2))/(guanine(2069)-N(7))-methyltransferase, partial [Acidobacteria bacterium]|nr:23S rRNA (guanine(2445)-N(2))/(guanine(2069)-N(7))-methyltransferase [Acidobacteriota bacterium]
MTQNEPLSLVATCALGLEELLEEELRGLGCQGIERQRAAVAFEGRWPDVWRANYRLRTANRVLVRLATWNGQDGDALAAGARN